MTPVSGDRQMPLRIMVWNAARGGMRSVVEAYQRDGFLAAENVTLVASYVDGGFLRRQIVLVAALIKFVWLLSTRRVALVHCHAAMRGSFWRKGLFSSIARLFGTPVILHLHGSEMKAFYAAQPDILKRMIRRHLERASLVLVLSQSWMDFVGEIAPAAQIFVVPNYVTVPESGDPQARNAAEILFLGLIGERKGVFDLIPAFAEVQAGHPAAHLTIAGNGEVARATAAVAQAGLQGAIALPGWTDGPAKKRLIEQAGIYVLPSHNEGLPMSVLEAMAAGLAVVTTRVGGIPELISDGVDGLLIAPGDRAGLANALDRLLGDDELRLRIAAAGRARIEDTYSDKVILPLLHDLYQQASATPTG